MGEESGCEVSMGTTESRQMVVYPNSINLGGRRSSAGKLKRGIEATVECEENASRTVGVWLLSPLRFELFIHKLGFAFALEGSSKAI